MNLLYLFIYLYFILVKLIIESIKWHIRIVYRFLSPTRKVCPSAGAKFTSRERRMTAVSIQTFTRIIGLEYNLTAVSSTLRIYLEYE